MKTLHGRVGSVDGAACLVRVVSYERKMFVKLTIGVLLTNGAKPKVTCLPSQSHAE